eukprot:COSAG01_NODE_679_length_14296_cov_250.437575_18_plen_200_part_00
MVGALAIAVPILLMVAARRQPPPAQQRRTVLTPSYVLRVLAEAERAGWPLGGAPPRQPLDRPALMAQAQRQVKQSQLSAATHLYRHLLAHDPFDEQALAGLFGVYDRLYDQSQRFSTAHNFTRSFLGLTEKHASRGGFDIVDEDSGQQRRVTVQRMSEALPVFQVDGLLSDEECHAIRMLHEDQIRNMYVPTASDSAYA